MVILFIFLIMENIMEKYIPILGYFDEVITIAMFCLLIFKCFYGRIHKSSLIILRCHGLLLLIGLLGSLIYQVQISKIAIAKDIMAVSKFFIVYVYAREYIKIRNPQKQLKQIEVFMKGYTIILFVFSAVNQFFNLGMDSGMRGPIKTYMFLYSHTTFMVASVVVINVLFLTMRFKKKRLYLLMTFVVLIASMRIKAYIYIVSVCLLYFLFKRHNGVKQNRAYRQNNRWRFAAAMGAILLVAYTIGKPKISSYLTWGLSAARPALYIVGFAIMKNFFPLGSGFATFASSLSGEYYSPLYYQYGISNTSGLRLSEGYQYIADTFWPYVYAQFGLFGIILYAYALIEILKNLFRDYQKDPYCLKGAIALFLYMIFTCFVESIMTNSTIVMIAMTLGYYFRLVIVNYASRSE